MENVQPNIAEKYISDEYLSENPEWHEEDAPWKAAHITAILDRNRIVPGSICDVGCGTGAIIELLSQHYPQAAAEGFEIAPHAYAMCIKRRSANLTFTMADAFQSGKHFDLCMAIDVIEHVENPFAFLRSMKNVARWHVLHIPLDMNALAVGRGWVLPEARRKLGHIHYFSRESAIALLAEAGLEVVDSFYTAWAIDQSHKTWKKRLAAWPRRIAFAFAPHATVRLIGGWSLMVLARA
jgi:ubiquinone/menaquinone biosynthesis C-methylase UbiE